MSDYTLLVNDERTVLVTIWENGTTTVALRSDPSEVWGKPIEVKEER